MTERTPLLRTPEEAAEDGLFLARYGAWAPLTPAQVAAELAGFDRPWWIVGGWAIEAATGTLREHEDTDLSVLASDVPDLVEHLSPRWHVWNYTGGVLRLLLPGAAEIEQPGSQLWLRADATSPWVLDVPLTPADADRWTHKFLPGRSAPVDEVTWVAEDGIRYLLPEIVLSYKARLRRPKDDGDLAATLPVLTPERRAWLHAAVAELDPGHPWLAHLHAAAPPGAEC